jgi:eukaryotic-like serine/threonine-protein kinase
MTDIIYNNRYRLDAKIGEGGMAVVYRGYDLLLRRQVAIKVLRPRFAKDSEFVARFVFEAQAAAKLSHPNIVNTYDVGHVDGGHYIVEEYVAGETLAALIARQGALPESTVVHYARQICAALAAAHRQELLHQDIKPSNILITREDVVRITDFGVAHVRGPEDLARSNSGRDPGVRAETVLGSVAYCSPEQLTGEGLSEASDLYSVGIVLYEMLAGHRPFGGPTSEAIATAHLSDPVPDLLSAGAEVSAPMQAIIHKLLRKLPGDRYQSAGEVLAALRKCARGEMDPAAVDGPDTATAVLRRRSREGEPAKQQRVKLPERPASWRIERAMLWAGGIVAAMVVIALIVAQQAASRSLRMPDLTGKSVAEAVAALRSIGVNAVSVRQRDDDTVQGGLVDGSDPAVNVRLSPSQPVTLIVSNGPTLVDVPNVVGQDPKVAAEFLTAQGFGVIVGNPIDSTAVKKGLVAATNPASNAPLEKGGHVVLLVSKGPPIVAVPNVVSLSLDDARKLLAAARLKIQINQTVDVPNIPANTVLSQDPAERSNASPGSTVLVDISGSGPATLDVPSVVGLSLDDARRALSQAGLTAGIITQAAVPNQAPGTVVSQIPGAYAKAPSGGAVDLIVVAGVTPAPQGTAGLGSVPDTTGMTVDEAKAVLERAGYHLGRVTVLPGAAPDAKVVGSDPAPGAVPPTGSNVVNLVVGNK